jgi:Rps23 Pro-64 3,4-dihydroxylase Tpa1-like proline 4-hydroxylase
MVQEKPIGLFLSGSGIGAFLGERYLKYLNQFRLCHGKDGCLSEQISETRFSSQKLQRRTKETYVMTNRITFGTLISVCKDSLRDFSPKGSSCITCVLVINDRKWSSFSGGTYILVVDGARTTEPLPCKRR